MKLVEIQNTMGEMNNVDFAQWIVDELARRGWSQSQAARRGEISSQMINAIVNGQSNPGLDFCRGIARAFNLPLEDVLRRAGILPAAVELPAELQDYGRRVMALSEVQRRRVLRAMGDLLTLAEEAQRPQRSSRG